MNITLNNFKSIPLLIKYLDIIICFFLLGLGFLIMVIGHIVGLYYLTEIGLAILTASTLYIFISIFFLNQQKYIPISNDHKLTIYLAINVVYFLCITTAIISTYFSLFLPNIFFILLSICISAIAAEVMLSYEKKFSVFSILIKIVIISLILHCSLFYEFPGYFGVDPWVHINLINTWEKWGHLNPIVNYEFSPYAYYPIFHLGVMITKILTSLDSKDSLFFSIGIFYTVSTIFIFYFSKCFINIKSAFFATLIISIGIFHVSWGAWIIPTTLGLGLFCIILYCIFSKNNNLKTILFLFLTLLVLEHLLSSFVILVALCPIVLTTLMFRYLNEIKPIAEAIHQKTLCKINISYLIIYFFGFLIFFYSNTMPFAKSQTDAFTRLFGGFVNSIQTESELTGKIIESSGSIYLLNRICFLLLTGIIILGLLQWIKYRHICVARISIIISIFFLVSFSYFPSIFNINTLIPGRWFPFIAIMCAPLAGQGILVISQLFTTQKQKLFLISIFIFIFAIFSLLSANINIYSPFLGDMAKDPSRNAIIESEFKALDTLSNFYSGQITTDNYYSEPISYEFWDSNKVLHMNPYLQPEGMILIRQYITNHKNEISKYPSLNNAYLLKITNNKNSLFYDNGQVSAYLNEY